MGKELKVVVYYLCQLQKNTHPVTLGQVDIMQLYSFIFFRLCSFWGLSRSLCIIISIIHTVHFAVFFQCSYISFISLYIYNTVVKVTRHVTYCSRVSILMDLSFGLRSGSLHKQHVTTHLQISVSVCPYTRHNRLLTERLTHLGALVPRWNL